MRLSYRVSRLLGSVHSNGNLVFLPPDGSSVLSAVRNRVVWVDLVEHTSSVLPFEARKDIKLMAVSNDGRLLVAVDVDGRAHLVNIQRRVVLHRLNYKKRVRALAFSPDDRMIAAAVGKQVQIWRTPLHRHTFEPMTLLRSFGGHHDAVTCLDWSQDSARLLAGSKDMCVRVYNVRSAPAVTASPSDMSSAGGSFAPITLTGHRDAIRSCFFDRTGDAAYSVARDGAVFIWRWQSDPEAATAIAAGQHVPRTIANGRWRLGAKRFVRPGRAQVMSVAFHRQRSLLVVGFSSGVFGVYDMGDAGAAAGTGPAGIGAGEEGGEEGSGCDCVHTLSVGQQGVTAAAVSGSGDWLAFGCAPAGQLLVWEWQAESYVLKQSGHGYRPNCLAFSPTGAVVATGGDDAKVKLWGAGSGFCFVTFGEHEAPVSAVAFTANGSAVLSASLDGTVRAHDLVRYKNFRTLATPRPAQLTCLALDSAGEVVAAGAMEPFDVFVWSLQTGRLLDVLSGHEAPLSELAFAPAGGGAAAGGMLASSSWDGTVKLWNVFKNELVETLEHSTDVLAVAYRPDGQQICAATLAGQLQLWGTENGDLQGIIEGRRDVAGGRRAADLVMAKTSAHSKYFTSCAYTADGTCVIAAGHSKFVCIYEVTLLILVKKFQISHNRSLDGVLDRLHSGRMTEAGSLDLLEDDGDSDDDAAAIGIGSGGPGKGEALPGAKRGDDGSRRAREEVRVSCVRFSPTGREWAAATVEGALLYSLDEDTLFDPFDIDEALTPAAVVAALGRREWGRALTAALHLNEEGLVCEALAAVPADQVPLTAAAVPDQYASRLLAVLAGRLQKSRRLEYHLVWCQAVLQAHGCHIRDRSRGSRMLGALRSVQRALAQCQTDLMKLVNDNLYTLRFLGAPAPGGAAAVADAGGHDADDDANDDTDADADINAGGEEEETEDKDASEKKEAASAVAGGDASATTPKAARRRRRAESSEDVAAEAPVPESAAAQEGDPVEAAVRGKAAGVKAKKAGGSSNVNVGPGSTEKLVSKRTKLHEAAAREKDSVTTPGRKKKRSK